MIYENFILYCKMLIFDEFEDAAAVVTNQQRDLSTLF